MVEADRSGVLADEGRQRFLEVAGIAHPVVGFR
jgi:hypothetical protein